MQCISAFPFVLLHKTCIDPLLLPLGHLHESDHSPYVYLLPIPFIGRQAGRSQHILLPFLGDAARCRQSFARPDPSSRSTYRPLSFYPHNGAVLFLIRAAQLDSNPP
jgi:hypothetical protein